MVTDAYRTDVIADVIAVPPRDTLTDTVVRHALAPKTATHSILTRTHVPTRLVTLALNQPPIIMMMTTTTAATTRHAQQHTPYFLKK